MLRKCRPDPLKSALNLPRTNQFLLSIYLLKLRSDQTDSVSVDLHQQRLNGDGRLLSFGHTCGRLRRRKIKSRHSRILGRRRQSGQKRTLAVPPCTERSLTLGAADYSFLASTFVAPGS